MSDIKSFLEYIYEADVIDPRPVVPPPAPSWIESKDIVKFDMSSKLMELLTPLKKDYKIANLLLKLRTGTPTSELIRDPANYFDVDNEGNISFLKPRYFTETNKWANTRRQKTKVTKILKEVYNEAFITSNVKQTDVESFVNRWTIVFQDEFEIQELRGTDLLRAYNYTEECIKGFGYTCANFHQGKNSFGGHSEPTLAEFDIYTKNPDNCGVVVIIQDKKIVGRLSFQQGTQFVDYKSRNRKKGDFVTVWGNYYGLSGRGGKFHIILQDYLKKKYPGACPFGNTGFCIPLETRFRRYCPFDSMLVNFKMNLLSDTYQIVGSPSDWHGTYHGSCPADLVAQRIKEEEEGNGPMSVHFPAGSDRLV